jgi:hypothetical protein
MLTIQFRMHPAIRAFPSQRFYGGLLTDSPHISLEVDAARYAAIVAYTPLLSLLFSY